MGRHRTAQEKQELGEQARQLRAAGRSRREIQQELGIGDDLAKAFLRGVPLPDSLARPRAKDADREAARAMRRAGKTYDQIAAELGVSKSTCSLWLRDLPHPTASLAESGGSAPQPPVEPVEVVSPQLRQDRARELRVEGRMLREIADELGVSAKTVYYWTWDLPVPPGAKAGGDKAHMEMMRRRYWDRVLAERDAERETVKVEHAERIGRLTPRELEIAAVVAYWCEGCKSKPYDRREQVTFINSDPGLILLFLAWLDQVEFPWEHRVLSLSIHESADVEAATAWWADIAGRPASEFHRAQLKRHNPRTMRKNTGETYAGCLIVRLRQCRILYQQIEGLWEGMMGGLTGAVAASDDDQSRVV